MQFYTAEEFDQILSEKGFPLLVETSTDGIPDTMFRGCHVGELDPSIKLSDIQGRPFDANCSGDLIHMTSSFVDAMWYAGVNKRIAVWANHKSTSTEDQRVCVVAYDSNLLAKHGKFTPDKNDGKGTQSAAESISVCKQVRWECPDIDGQCKRLEAIKFAIFDRKIYLKSQLYNLMSASDDTHKLETQIDRNQSYIAETNEGSTFFRLHGNRITTYSATSIALSEKTCPQVIKENSIVVLDGYCFRVLSSFTIWSATSSFDGDLWHSSGLTNSLNHQIRDGSRKLFEEIYPIVM